MTVQAFITSFPAPTTFTRTSAFTTRRMRHPPLRAPAATPLMSGKGFGTKPTPSPSPSSPDRKSPPPSSPRDPDAPLIDPDFVPTGPTLRQEYERRGLLEPTRNPDAGVLPEVVANRMLRRILTFGAVPLGMLFAFFAAYFVLKYKYDITVIPVAVAYSTLGTIALSTVGITYGIFSSSWDEDVEGSKLGFEEAKVNFLRAKDGLIGARRKEKQDEEFQRLDKLNEYRNKKKE